MNVQVSCGWLTGGHMTSDGQVEPCIGYRFALESEEDDMRKNFHSTSDVVFKTSAVASLVSLDRARFSVGYHWDPVRHVSDLKLASIKFPKSLIKNVNCLDYIQVTSEAA